MPFVPLYELFPDLAKRETRTVTVMREEVGGVPKGEYTFLELFCDERGCDCRRVFFSVITSRRKDVEAVITYGWEAPEFYARWLKEDAPEMVAEVKGPSLNLGSPQSEIAPAILELFCRFLLPDKSYMERVERHYALFRDAIDDASSRRGSARRRQKRSPA